MTFELPALPYDYDALEPHIDEETMKLHHDKHHNTYVNGLNEALKDQPDWQDKSAIELMQDIDQLPEEIQTAVRNNGGGHVNHSLFWQVMSADGGQLEEGELAEAINESFGSFDQFKEQFKAAATGQFGSGWAWLVVDDGDLVISSSPNQDNPYMDGKTPILGIDVWEHAYYLNYKNARADWVDHFFEIINWQEVEKRYQQAK